MAASEAKQREDFLFQEVQVAKIHGFVAMDCVQREGLHVGPIHLEDGVPKDWNMKECQQVWLVEGQVEH